MREGYVYDLRAGNEEFFVSRPRGIKGMQPLGIRSTFDMIVLSQEHWVVYIKVDENYKSKQANCPIEA